MTQRKRRAAVSKSGVGAKFDIPEGRFRTLMENVAGDIGRYWRHLVETPIQAIVGFVAFLASITSIIEMLTKDSDSRSSGSGSMLDGIEALLSASVPMKVLTSLVFSCSIGWTCAVVSSWLTSRKNDGSTVVAVALAIFSGAFVSAWSTSFLLKTDINRVGLQTDMTLILVTFCICAATLVAKTKYRLTHESALDVIEQRATTLVLFTLAAVGVTLVSLADVIASKAGQ
jgi:hypothetical protein